MKDILVAAFILISSILSPVALSGKFSFEHYYRWDSFWYESVVDRGYISSIPPLPQRKDDSNVVCFPAYPALAALLKSVTGLSTAWSLIFVAWLFAWAFWFLIIRSFRQIGLETSEICLGVFAIWCFPTAFFLNAAYTESLFLSAVLLFLGSSHFSVRVIAGLTLGLTRLVGVPLAILAFLRQITAKSRQWLIFLSPILGVFLFFLYTKLKFGMWDLYPTMAKIGWNVSPDYLFFLRPQTWKTEFLSPLQAWQEINVDIFSWNTTTIFTWILLISVIFVGVQSFKIKKLYHNHIAYLLASGVLYFIPAAGFYNLRFMSMSRYMLPVFIFWLLWFAATCKDQKRLVWFWVAMAALIVWGLPFKLSLLNRFISGMWVS